MNKLDIIGVEVLDVFPQTNGLKGFALLLKSTLAMAFYIGRRGKRGCLLDLEVLLQGEIEDAACKAVVWVRNTTALAFSEFLK